MLKRIMLIKQASDGWILLDDGDRWVNIPPDELEHPYGPNLPSPRIPQNQIIGRWLMRKPGWDL